MRGLDLRIHSALPHNSLAQFRLGFMDCRVKPGNDSGEGVRVTKRRVP
jgi:hypothetical protein